MCTTPPALTENELQNSAFTFYKEFKQTTGIALDRLMQRKLSIVVYFILEDIAHINFVVGGSY
eukprot:scaffold285795_cov19-Tisochrysis_lutea.AAC.1